MRRQASLRDNNALTAPTEKGAGGRRREAGGVTTFGNDAVQPILVPGGQSSLQLEFSALDPLRQKERGRERRQAGQGEREGDRVCAMYWWAAAAADCATINKAHNTRRRQRECTRQRFLHLVFWAILVQRIPEMPASSSSSSLRRRR